MSERFEARRILVTGGSLGIGLEVSRELARRGGRVIVAARGIEAIEAAIDTLEGSGHEGISIDVSDPRVLGGCGASDRRRRRAQRARDRRGGPRPDRCARGPPAADLIETIAINLLGTMLALRFALPRLRACGGRAVTFSGGGGTSPLPRYDAYAASKAAVVRLTENLAASGEIEINAVAPGFVATRMHDETLRAGPEAAGQSYYTRTQAVAARGRIPGVGGGRAGGIPAGSGGGRHQRPADQRPVGSVAGGGVPGTLAERLRPGEVATNRRAVLHAGGRGWMGR